MTPEGIAVRLLIVIAVLLVSLVAVRTMVNKIAAYVRLRRWWAIRREREERAVWAFFSSLPTRAGQTKGSK